MKPGVAGRSSGDATVRGAAAVEVRATARRSGDWSVALRRPKFGDLLRGAAPAENIAAESLRAGLGHLAALLAERLLRRLDTPAAPVHFVQVRLHVAAQTARGSPWALQSAGLAVNVTLETERTRAEVLAALDTCLTQGWPSELQSLVGCLAAPQIAIRSSVQLRVT